MRWQMIMIKNTEIGFKSVEWECVKAKIFWVWILHNEWWIDNYFNIYISIGLINQLRHAIDDPPRLVKELKCFDIWVEQTTSPVGLNVWASVVACRTRMSCPCPMCLVLTSCYFRPGTRVESLLPETEAL